MPPHGAVSFLEMSPLCFTTSVLTISALEKNPPHLTDREYGVLHVT